jgi:hypothetical protein
MFPALPDRFAAWREQYRNSMQSFELFAGGGGGFGGIITPDKATLNRIMVETRLRLSAINRPMLDGDTALGQGREIMGQMIGGVPGARSGGEPSH